MTLILATESEVQRHIELLGRGLTVPQETRGFNEQTGETYPLRSKEDAPDYRYMPDPNLPPVILSEVGRNLLQAVLTYTEFRMTGLCGVGEIINA